MIVFFFNKKLKFVKFPDIHMDNITKIAEFRSRLAQNNSIQDNEPFTTLDEVFEIIKDLPADLSQISESQYNQILLLISIINLN